MSQSPDSSPVTKVRRRTVFYLSGFDPKGASHYHALYRDEAAKQSRVSGIQMQIGRRCKTNLGNATWHVNAQTTEGTVDTRYEFLRWDDIVRKNWTRNQLQLMWAIMATTWLNLRHGTLWRILKVAWPPFVALFAPFLLLCAVLIGAPLLAMLVFSVAAPSVGPMGASALAFAPVAFLVLLGRWLEKKYSMLWLMRSYAFTARQAEGRIPELEARLDQHAHTLLTRIESVEDDEILLVGHSSGTMMATSILAKALRLNPLLGKGGPVVSLLTLGQCMPLLGCLPMAQTYRDDLQVLASAQSIAWLDFSAPSDGCCFALVDPLAASGIENSGRTEDRPKLLSPRFAEMYEPSAYAEIRRDKFRVHFQYLMASEKAVKYDYFAMTAGTMTLADRFRADRSINDYKEFKIFKS